MADCWSKHRWLLVAAGLVVAGSTVVARPGAAPAAVCTGIAPQTTSCTTGIHAGMLLQPGHGGIGGPGYTGTLESRLTLIADTTKVRSSRCDYVDGVEVGCVSDGYRPNPREAFRQDCYSYNYATTTLGGSGPWLCEVIHV